ncbi:hypothetical protein [Chelativorans sp. J32]|jgi:hypothetical protein|uniref:hypothetical protein n=1 Tax=Chelativorans sp. J32 TaxID=935840 RepID=UPI0004ADE3FB|nr:hypothetical protein [Chelativorans sp. J32]
MSVIWTIVLLWFVVPVSVFLSAAAFLLVIGDNFTGQESDVPRKIAQPIAHFDPFD